MLNGFPPIIGKNAKILILGSMPSLTSLEKQEYYGFKHNRFWKILSAYFHEEFECYEDKIACIKKYHMILWDVIASCNREGSLDSAIRNEVVNDIASLVENNPSVRLVLCNGKKSYDLYMRHFKQLDIEVISLPSTSNANRTIKEEALFSLWYDALDKGLKK